LGSKTTINRLVDRRRLTFFIFLLGCRCRSILLLSLAWCVLDQSLWFSDCNWHDMLFDSEKVSTRLSLPSFVDGDFELFKFSLFHSHYNFLNVFILKKDIKKQRITLKARQTM
jgi:hypothetical protein